MMLRENEWYLKAPWGRMCVIAWGNSLDPPVLLCHGVMDSAAGFRPLVQRLPKNFYYIAMEFPGCGLSDRLPPGLMLNTYDLVYSIDAVVRHFRWESFVLIGHSYGAFVAKHYNVCCPGKVSKLIELDLVNYIGFTPEMFPAWYRTFYTKHYENMDKYNVPKGRSRKIPWNKAIETVKKARGLTEKDAAAILERLTAPAGNGLIRYTFDPRIRTVTPPCHTAEHIRKVFTNIKTPTLGIISEESYEKGLYQSTEFLIDEASYPAKNYRCRRVTGNHDVHVVNPGLVASYVSQFLLHGLEGLDSKAKL